jgi:hypothetical protein
MVETARRAVHFFGAPSPRERTVVAPYQNRFLESIEAESKPVRAGFARSLPAPSVSLRH